MGLIKDRNGRDQQAEHIKKRWQEYKELYKRGFNHQDNHDGGVTHLEPDILEYEVVLRKHYYKKTNGGDGIPAELSKIVKDDAVKCCTQYASKFGKFGNRHRRGEGQFSFQSPRKAMPKNAQTTTHLHSSHMLVK